VSWLRRRRAAEPPPPDVPWPDTHGHRLAELRHLPAVASALSSAPPVWRTCGQYPDADGPDDIPLDDVLEHISLRAEQNHWGFSLDDEVFDLFDLEADPADDPITRTLESHPAVNEADQLDREVFVFVVSRPISAEAAAALVARAVLAGHRYAARRAGIQP
jgi:hypothetical protein